MIVVAIIGILAAIAIPKFSQLIVKGNEANTKGNLGAIRSALSIYYGDMEGWYPTGATALNHLTADGKYMAAIPVAKLPAVPTHNAGHTDSNAVTLETVVTDAAGWSYNNDRTTNDWGRVLVACTHRDTRGTNWTTY